MREKTWYNAIKDDSCPARRRAAEKEETRQEDSIEANNPGSIYYYYPTNSAWNSDKKSYLNEACDITKQNPNSQRPLISAETGGFYCIVYMERDSRNSTNGYDIADIIYISVWDDPDNYGGRK